MHLSAYVVVVNVTSTVHVSQTNNFHRTSYVSDEVQDSTCKSLHIFSHINCG